MPGGAVPAFAPMASPGSLPELGFGAGTGGRMGGTTGGSGGWPSITKGETEGTVTGENPVVLVIVLPELGVGGGTGGRIGGTTGGSGGCPSITKGETGDATLGEDGGTANNGDGIGVGVPGGGATGGRYGCGAGGSGGIPSCAIRTPRDSFTKPESDFAAITVAEDESATTATARIICFPYGSCIGAPRKSELSTAHVDHDFYHITNIGQEFITTCESIRLTITDNLDIVRAARNAPKGAPFQWQQPTQQSRPGADVSMRRG